MELSPNNIAKNYQNLNIIIHTALAKSIEYHTNFARAKEL